MALSYTYSATKDYAHAIADYGQVIALDPKDADAFNGRCYCRRGISLLLDFAIARFPLKGG
jgi:hypothetical protein